MILNINKPSNITSHDVVDEVRRITGEQRVGHAGTLDPFATGVLIVAVGRENTKKLGEITKNTEKEYIALVELGKTSTTGDPEGIITVTASSEQLQTITENHVIKSIQKFLGEITQTPPSYSAIKIQGQPAYKLARKGKHIDMPDRKVTIHELELLEFNLPFVKLRIACSSGTYIRTLGEDIGKVLGVGAYLTELTRTRVGDYAIEKSITLKDLSKELPLLF